MAEPEAAHSLWKWFTGAGIGLFLTAIGRGALRQERMKAQVERLNEEREKDRTLLEQTHDSVVAIKPAVAALTESQREIVRKLDELKPHCMLLAHEAGKVDNGGDG